MKYAALIIDLAKASYHVAKFKAAEVAGGRITTIKNDFEFQLKLKQNLFMAIYLTLSNK